MMMPQYDKNSVVNKKTDFSVGEKLNKELINQRFVLGNTNVVVGTTKMENEDGQEVFVFDLSKTSFFTAFKTELMTADGKGESRSVPVSTKVFTPHAEYGLGKLANAVSLNAKDRKIYSEFLSTLGVTWSKLLDENAKCFRKVEEVDSDGNKTGETVLECKMDEDEYKDHMKEVASELLKPITDILNGYTGREFIANVVRDDFIGSNGEAYHTYKLRESKTL